MQLFRARPRGWRDIRNLRGIDVDASYSLGEPQVSSDSKKGGGVAGGKAAKWGIVDMLGGKNDGREGGNVGIKAG